MSDYCRHHECQCGQSADLAWMSDRLHRNDLLVLAVQVHQNNEEVRCRHVPRPSNHGRPNAPLPPRKEAA